MKKFEDILADFYAISDEHYRVFNERIANIPGGSSIGVRIPQLRTYAKKLVQEEDFSIEELFHFPHDIYEIRLLKCLCAGYRKVLFSERVSWIGYIVGIMDGWSVCDVFCSTLRIPIAEKRSFLQKIEYYIRQKKEFTQRFAYVCLLGNYMEREYLDFITSALDRAEAQFYYAHMGAAWLLCEVLVRFYEEGVKYIQNGNLALGTKNKAIQKACESYRLSDEQKNFLKLWKKG